MCTARSLPAFPTLPGPPDLTATYGPIDDLFPVFAGRLMERSRADLPSYVPTLDLPLDVGDLDILGLNLG